MLCCSLQYCTHEITRKMTYEKVNDEMIEVHILLLSGMFWKWILVLDFWKYVVHVQKYQDSP